MNEYFARVTGGAVENIAWKIKVQSVRAAWEYVKENKLPVIDVMPEPEDFVLPESEGKRVEFVHSGTCQCNRSRAQNAPKRQQNLVGIIAEVLRERGAMGAAAIRAILDESGLYEFKRGVEGYVRTRQITSAIANHLKKYGDAALLQKVDGGYVAREGGAA